MWEFMALVFTELAELAKRMGIGDMLKIPREEIIHFPDDRHRNVQSIANFAFRNIAAVEKLSSKLQAWPVHRKRAERAGLIQTFRRVCRVPGCDFVEHDLRKDAVETRP